MLLRELRRDTLRMPEPTAPPAYYDDNTRQDSTPSLNVPNRAAAAANSNNNHHHNHHHNNNDNDYLDDHMTIYETMEYYWERGKRKILHSWIRSYTWYQAQPEDVQTLLKVLLALIVLYVMFGGRFGLTGWGTNSRGSYSFYDPIHLRVIDITRKPIMILLLLLRFLMVPVQRKVHNILEQLQIIIMTAWAIKQIIKMTTWAIKQIIIDIIRIISSFRICWMAPITV
jgi:hypothetical protein